MARRVFFSFHYENDVWRAGQVRNSWVTKDREAAGFWDAASWEEVKRKGEDSIKRWIDQQMTGTSVTVVLIGTDTASRKYVRYEIIRSHELGKGILGIRIHNMKDVSGNTCAAGASPFDSIYLEQGGGKKYLSSIYPTYDWVLNAGYTNLGLWVESAAKAAGR